MTNLLHIILITLRVRFSLTANRFIHFLRRIPGLKKVIYPEIYGVYFLKMIFTVLGAFFIVNMRIILHIISMSFIMSFGVVIYLIVLNDGIRNINSEGMILEGIVNYALYAWFAISFVVGLTQSTVTSSNHKVDDIMLNKLLANAKTYAHSQILISRFAEILLSIPLLLIAFTIVDIPLWGIATTLVMLLCFRLTGEAVNLSLYKRFGKHFASNNFFAFMPILLILPTSVFVATKVNVFNMSAIFANPILTLITVPFGIFSWVCIKKYPLYLPLMREKVKRYNDIMAQAVKQQRSAGLNFADAQKWNKNLTQEDLQLQAKSHENKTGFAYLNAIFFERHGKYLKKKLSKRIIISLALPAIALVFSIYCAAVGAVPAEALNLVDLPILFNYSPIFFFIIYIASMGKPVTASVFSNCDIHMLHYSYYRTKETILSSFRVRFATILRYNFIVTSIMAISVISAAWLIYGHMEIVYAGIFFVILSLIGVLFSFNDLFLYYVIQPYDCAGDSKSTAYKIINAIVYFVSWLNFTSTFEFITYTFVIIGGAVLYIGVGMLLLLLFAPKKFKLR